MRTFFGISMIVLCLFGTAWSESEGEQYVYVTDPLVNVYERLDPQSPIIVHAKKGDYFPLVYDGTSWYQVSVKGTTGWIEKRDGKVIDQPPALLLSLTPGSFFLVLLVLIIAAGGIAFVILRQKQAEA